MGKKWYSFFVVTDTPETALGTPPGQPTAAPATRRVEDLVPEPTEAARSAAPLPALKPSADLAVVYEAAKILPPPHGYTVLKVAEMLQSEHIRTLPPDVRRKSVLVALDAAGVKIEEVVEDAVRRDRALDTYERVLQEHVDGLIAKTTAENRELEAEIARRAAELRAKIEHNTRQLESEQAELQTWRSRKRQEEALIAEAIGYFVAENPVTSQPSATQGQGDADVR